MTEEHEGALGEARQTDPSHRRSADLINIDVPGAYEDAFGLGGDLAARRQEIKMSQTELARITGVPQADISRIESGKANPTLTTLQKITKALNLRIHLRPK